MKKVPNIYLQHIIESIDLIESYTQGMTAEDFYSSINVQDAVIRRLEIIGEATKNISSEYKSQYTGIPWKRMAGMRDVMIHHYFGIDLTIVWRTITVFLPLVKQQLKALQQ